MRSAVFDIESSALEGIGAGMLLCVCVRPLSTQRTRTFRLDEYVYKDDDKFGKFEREEKELTVQVLDELAKYDLLIGQNVEGFDLGFLRTRALRRGIPWTLMPLTYDTKCAFRRTKYRTVLNGYGKPSAALDMIADLMGITQMKTKIYPMAHWETIWGNKKQRTEAMDDLVQHCQSDVVMTTRLYEMLLPADMRVSLKRWM